MKKREKKAISLSWIFLYLEKLAANIIFRGSLFIQFSQPPALRTAFFPSAFLPFSSIVISSAYAHGNLVSWGKFPQTTSNDNCYRISVVKTVSDFCGEPTAPSSSRLLKRSSLLLGSGGRTPGAFRGPFFSLPFPLLLFSSLGKTRTYSITSSGCCLWLRIVCETILHTTASAILHVSNRSEYSTRSMFYARAEKDNFPNSFSGRLFSFKFCATFASSSSSPAAAAAAASAAVWRHFTADRNTCCWNEEAKSQSSPVARGMLFRCRAQSAKRHTLFVFKNSFSLFGRLRSARRAVQRSMGFSIGGICI